MAVYKIFPVADATIYSAYPALNTGLDEILEANTNFIAGDLKTSGEYPQSSRYLIKFSNSEIIDILNNKVSSSSWAATLRCFNAEAYGVAGTTAVAINAVAEDWNMGTGRYSNMPQTENGVSWQWRTYSGSGAWSTGTFPVGTTGSYNLTSNPNSAGGGVWYTASEVGQVFDYYTLLDIEVNVTDIVSKWYSGSFNNYGFIVRQTQSQEFINNINAQTTIKYYSRDTHTIYPPQLEIKWNDYTYITSSLPVLSTTPATIQLDNNPGIFYSGSVNVFRVNARPTYPPRVWQTGSWYTTNYALPSSSYYAIKDLDTNEFVVDFDSTYTRISCDTTGSYFKVYMNGLEPERYYKMLVKTEINGNVLVIDENYYFKVVNG